MKRVGDYFESQKVTNDNYAFVISGDMFYEGDNLMLTTSFSNVPSEVNIGLDSNFRDSEHDSFLEIREGWSANLYHMGKISGVTGNWEEFKTENEVKKLSDIIKSAFESLGIKETRAAIYVTRNMPLNEIIGHYE